MQNAKYKMQNWPVLRTISTKIPQIPISKIKMQTFWGGGKYKPSKKTKL